VPSFTAAPEEPVESFERGIDLDSPRTAIKKGGYEDAQNMLLACESGGAQHLCTVRLDAELDSGITWPAGNVRWFAPYTFSTFSAGTLTFSSHLVIARTDGSVHRYDTGSPGTTTLVRRGLSASQDYWTHATYDQWVLTFNGRDAPMKYGQHFLFADQNEARPFLFPLGSKPITPAGPAIALEAWTFGGASAFVADASVPGGGSRVHTSSLLVSPSQNAFNSWTSARNFLSGPQPYGGTDFAGTDFFVFQYFKSATAGNIRVRFGDDAGANYFEFTVSTITTGAWTTAALLRSSATTTGAPNWNSIKRVTVFNDDAVNNVHVDDFYMLYANAPAALQVACEHKGRVVGGGAPIAGSASSPALSTLFWSRANFPDEFPAANNQIMSGGFSSLAKTNQITAVREYQDSVIVGTPHTIFAWTVGTDGSPSKSVVTSELGIDAHRAIVETPAGSLLFTWQRGIYILRATGRGYASQKVASLLKSLWLEEPWWTVGAIDERTKTVRFWFREKTNGNPTKTTKGLIFDYVRAQDLGEAVWPSTMTQLADYATSAYVNGLREVLYGRLDSNDIFRLHATSSGTLTSYVRLPWMSREGSDRLVKWMGLVVPYAATSPVTVRLRTASNPEQFEGATFSDILALPATPGVAEPARVLFGSTARWVQVEFRATAFGFEVFPPVEMIAVPTKRVP
jgi:hypothetical protein